MSIESVMLSNHLISCCPLLLLPSIFFPSITVLSSDSSLHIKWPKYWSFSFSISPSNEYSGLISFRIDWFDLFAVQGTLKSLLQHYNLKVSICCHSAFKAKDILYSSFSCLLCTLLCIGNTLFFFFYLFQNSIRREVPRWQRNSHLLPHKFIKRSFEC